MVIPGGWVFRMGEVPLYKNQKLRNPHRIWGLRVLACLTGATESGSLKAVDWSRHK